MSLTPSQELAYKELEKYFEKNSVIYLSGPEKSGKTYLARKFISKEPLSVEVNIMEWVGYITHGMELKERLEQFLTTYEGNEYVFITHWEHLMLFISSTRFRMCGYANQYIITFNRNLENQRFKTLITVDRMTGQSLVSENAWIVALDVTEEDIVHMIRTFHDVEEDITEVAPFTKRSTISDVIMYTVQANKGLVKGKTWVERYKGVQAISNPISLDTEKVVINPNMDIHMLGVDHIIAQINRDIINPIKLGNPAIPICRGVLLYGPSGTGKTTIGRWLSYQLKGKMYLCERSRHEGLLTAFTRILNEASLKAPAVVFVDDIDTVLHNPDSIRDLLILLDGINIKGRENITVVMTCMDISLVPAALHRGGRMETCIEFTYPTIEIVQKIITNRFEKSIKDMEVKYPKVAEKLREEINPKIIKRMSGIVNGWSPSNIQLLADIIIRNSVIGKFDVMDTFVEESNKLIKLSKKTLSVNHSDMSNGDSLYV